MRTAFNWGAICTAKGSRFSMSQNLLFKTVYLANMSQKTNTPLAIEKPVLEWRGSGGLRSLSPTQESERGFNRRLSHHSAASQLLRRLSPAAATILHQRSLSKKPFGLARVSFKVICKITRSTTTNPPLKRHKKNL